MSNWERETAARILAGLYALGATPDTLASTQTTVGLRLSLANGEEAAAINADLVEGELASVEMRTTHSWLKDFDTKTESQQADVGELLEHWFDAVYRGEIVERVHKLSGLILSRELLISGRVALTAGMPMLRILATSSIDRSFAAYTKES